MTDAVFESLLNNDVLIERRTRTPDGRGGWVITYVEIGTVRGRMRPASSSERDTAAREERIITHVLYVSAETDIARGDLATIDGLTVEVQGPREPSRADHHLEIDCQERLSETSESGS